METTKGEETERRGGKGVRGERQISGEDMTYNFRDK